MMFAPVLRKLAFIVAVVVGLLVPAAPASAGHCNWSYGYTSSHSWTSDPCNSWGTYLAKYPPGYVVDAAACWNC